MNNEPSFIPEHLREEILNRIDLVDLISDYTRLKKAGKSFKGLCPFHNEDTPSFNVDPIKNLYHCFGCNASGNALTFLKSQEKLSSAEAWKLLAERAGVVIPIKPQDKQYTDLISINSYIADYFHKNLKALKADHPVMQYLESRKISPQMQEIYQLGYAKDGWDNLINWANQQGIPKESLLKLGMLVESDKKKIYDRFRNRIIFPLASIGGTVLGYAGRVIDPNDQPKYLNSPETFLYHKSTYLFGLNLARNAINQERSIIVVEGYMDHLRLHEAGIKNVVASSGTAFTYEQAVQIKRYADEVILMFDNDLAGKDAARRSLEKLLSAGLWITLASLKDKKDPDDYITTYGAETMLAQLSESQEWIEIFAKLYAKANTKEKRELSGEAANLIAHISDKTTRAIYFQKASELFNIPVEDLRVTSSFNNVNRDEIIDNKEYKYDDFIYIIMCFPEYLDNIKDDLNLLSFQLPQHLVEIIMKANEFHDKGKLNEPKDLLHYLEDADVTSEYSRILTKYHKVIPKEMWSSIWSGILYNALYLRLQELKSLLNNQDITSYDELILEHQNIKKRLAELDNSRQNAS